MTTQFRVAVVGAVRAITSSDESDRVRVLIDISGADR